MKTKIGYKETSSIIAIFSLGVFLIRVIPRLLVSLSNGIWINLILEFILTLLFYGLVCKYFNRFNEFGFFEYTDKFFGKCFCIFIGVIFFLFIVIYTFSTFNEFSDILSALTHFESFNKVRLTLFFVSFICAYFGIEALSRYGFISLGFIYVLFAFILYCIFGAIKVDNLTPLFGNDTFLTFTKPDFLMMFFIPLFVVLMSDLFKNKSEMKKCAFLSVLKVFLISLFVVVIFSLTIPKDMITTYTNPLFSIFYVSASGEVFHRFEILIISLYTLIMITSLSFGIILSSHILTKISKISDYRPFVIVISVIMYFLTNINFGLDLLYLSSVILSVLTFFIICVFCVAGIFLKHR